MTRCEAIPSAAFATYASVYVHTQSNKNTPHPLKPLKWTSTDTPTPTVVSPGLPVCPGGYTVITQNTCKEGSVYTSRHHGLLIEGILVAIGAQST